MSKLSSIFILSIYFILVLDNIMPAKTLKCNLTTEIRKEIDSYQPIVSEIINKIIYGKYKGTTYKHLVNFIDKFGSRSVGSASLEDAIDYMLDKSDEFNLENVHGEKVSVPHWVRGNESATLWAPKFQSLAMLGLGNSIGTNPRGIIAEAVVVNSFDELEKMAYKTKGKIVVFNQEYIDYEETVKYRMYGASIASRYGAVAALIRSITQFSLNTPHGGVQMYRNNVTKIPAACITMEDAIMLRRLQEEGKKIIIELKMEAKYLKSTTSRNVVADIVGRDQPKKLVVTSGHLDSWDIGQGAMDDGGGSLLTWNALVVLKALGLKPARTIRAILWTAEEIGILGASAYVKAHKNEIENLNFVMESDGGTFSPHGLQFSGLPQAACIVQEVLNLLSSINTTQFKQPAEFAPDISTWLAMGVPGANLYSDRDRYFWYHHTSADTLEVENSTTLDIATALWASVAYVIADLTIDLPKILTNKTKLRRNIFDKI